MLISKSLDGKKYLIKDSIPTFNWKIFEEFKTINVVNCLKATTWETEIALTAWFVRKPGYDWLGPEYYGIENALIMELQRPSFTFLAVKIENDDKSMSFYLPEDGEIVDFEEYGNAEKAFLAKMGIFDFKK